MGAELLFETDYSKVIGARLLESCTNLVHGTEAHNCSFANCPHIIDNLHTLHHCNKSTCLQQKTHNHVTVSIVVAAAGDPLNGQLTT